MRLVRHLVGWPFAAARLWLVGPDEGPGFPGLFPSLRPEDGS